MSTNIHFTDFSAKHLFKSTTTDIAHFYERKSFIMFDYAPDLLKRKQCQQLLQISKSKMLEFIHEDLIPAHIIAGQFRIEKKDLIDFVQNSLYWRK